MPPTHIAILGGGLTGLSATFHLTRRFPSSQITLFEKEPRLGGWVSSERVQVRDSQGRDASVLLEAGPRTLRPNAKSVLELIHLLDLSGSLITTPTSSPAAKVRFLHLPPTPGLIAIPSTFSALLTSPLSPLLFRALLNDAFRRANRPPGITDESVDAFLTRRFGPEFARVFGSAVIHGVYAADAQTISVNAAVKALWAAEARGGGSVIRGALLRSVFRVGSPPPREDEEADVGGRGSGYEMGDVLERMEGVSVFSFRDGVQTITDALERRIARMRNVRICRGVGVASLRPTAEAFEILTTKGDAIFPSHVVSTLPLPALHTLLPQSHPLPHLTANPSSSVTLINLVFPSSPSSPLHPPGFGYLVPRPPAGYAPAHPGILGTVFDSCALAQQDVGAAAVAKLTVMLGGPHPLGPAHTALDTVLAHLSAHLAPPPRARSSPHLPDPLCVRVRRHVDCIPALGVGHVGRMGELRAALGAKGGGWGGRLEVVGAGVGGVSVGDCVEAGRGVGAGWA